MKKNWLLAAIAAGCVMLAPATLAGVNAWTIDGPEGDTTIWVAIHPTQPDTMFAQAGSGLYRTTDAGAHWTPVPAPAFSIDGIHFDPGNSDRVFLVLDSVYRSTDGGQTFVPAGQPEESGLSKLAITTDGTLFGGDSQSRLYRSTDQGSQWQSVTVPWTHQDGFAGITTIVSDPNAPNTIYVGHEPAGLFRSDDGGATWAPQAGVTPGDAFSIGAIRTIAVQPGDSDRLLVGTSRYWFTSTTRGATWSQHTASNAGASWVGFDPGAPDNAVVLNALGDLFRSPDSGDTWPGAPSPSLKSLALHAAFAPSREGRLLVATSDGPMLSDDGGATFAPRVTGMRGGRVAGFAASSDGTLYAGYELGPFGVFRRDPSGWTPVDNAALRAAVPVLPRITSIASSPADPDALFVVDNTSELFVSPDRGDTWNSPGFVDVNAAPQNIAVDPANAAVIYVTTQNDGVWKSSDGGVNWTKTSQGLPDNTHAIGIDPTDPDILYVSSQDPVHAIYKSTNGGASWAPTGSFRSGTISGFTFHPIDNRIVYAYSGFDVLRTTDGGQSWWQMNFGVDHGVNVRGQAVLIDPVHPTTMFVIGPHNGGGFFRSVDGGSLWEVVPYESPPGEIAFLDRAALDPMRPNVLHVAVTGHGIAEFEVSPDLSVIIEGLENPIAADSEVGWLVTVRNEGPLSSSPAELRIAVPAWLETVTAPGCTIAATQLTCAVPALRAGFPLILEIRSEVAQEPATGDIVATVEGYESDPDMTNNDATFTVESTLQAPLEVAIERDDPLPRGDATGFVAEIFNPGPSRVRDLRLELVMPTFTITGVISVPEQCTHTETTLSCLFGTLEALATVSVRVNVTLNDLGLNQMSGAATREGDDDEAVVPLSASMRSLPVTDVQVQVTESADPVFAGRPLSYLVTLTNAGPDPVETLVTMSGPGLTFTNVATVSGGCSMSGDGSSATCSMATLASGAQATIQVPVSAPLPGEATFTASVTFEGRDTDPENDSDTARTAILSPPPPSSPPSGGKGGGKSGGGGAFDWLAALALGVLAWRRCVATVRDCGASGG